MEYLLDLAQHLLPYVRGAASSPIGSSRHVLSRLAKQCDQMFAVQQKRRLDHEARSRHGSRVTASSQNWTTATGECAIEILADVLAREAAEIPEALVEARLTTFYPAFLSYLADTVIERAQPAYQPRSAKERIWWYVWTWFAAREYVALLRDRHETVARVLATTSSWHKVRGARAERQGTTVSPPPDRGGSRPDPPGTTASMLGVFEVTTTARDVTAKSMAALKSAANAVRSSLAQAPEEEWSGVVELLGEDGPGRHEFLETLKGELLVDPALVRRLADVSAAAVPFVTAFDVELQEIQASRRRRLANDGQNVPSVPRYAPSAAADMKLFGLALSGGGIRSATFNLGVLQALSEIGLLRHVDYLSTVSGGGYIGAWLSTWIKRVRRKDSRGVLGVEDRLRVEPIPSPEQGDVRAVRFLREYSNYLTPKTGFLSADTWTMVAIWLRNTLLNQLVLVLTLASMLMVPWVIWFAFCVSREAAASTGGAGLFGSAPTAMTISVLLLVGASWVSGQQLRRFTLPAATRTHGAGQMLGQGGVLFAIVTPVVIAAWVIAAAIFHALPRFSEDAFWRRSIVELGAIFLSCLLIVAVRGRYWRCFLAERVSSRSAGRVWWMGIVWAVTITLLASGLASVAGAASIAAMASLVAGTFAAPEHARLSIHWVAFGVPVMVGVLSLILVLKIGILGRNLFDEHREWWSRLGAWLNIVSLGWLTLFALAIYSPYLLEIGSSRVKQYIVASGGVAWATLTIVGVLLGKDRTSALTGVLKNPRMRRWFTALAPYVFIVGLLIIVSAASYALVIGTPRSAIVRASMDTDHWMNLGQRWHWLLAGPAGLLALAFLLSCRVDVNEFSMHHFYKNRLVRCYLGASRDRTTDVTPRTPDPFTGFDAGDDVDIADLRLAPCGRDEALRSAKRQQNPDELFPYIGPLPIINTTLNLVTGDDLAWQERKAQSFPFTPFYSGYEFRDKVPSDNQSSPANGARSPRFAPYGFRPTLLYGYPPFGIGLGTAVAISGAAASPNMGYHSSSASAFLMTMFNARLGWWMGNPRDNHNWLRSSPRRGLLYLLNELFGLTNDRTHFVNLSDGGHFENLGIYELVRRRCRYVIACDAEQDRALTFSGLGNAIRKCRTDLGAEISVRATRIHPPEGSAHSTLHCVVGDIKYPNGELGTLLYLKASVTGDEPADVLEYEARQPSFPHHSTVGDQFFDESQFESYRKLGFHVAQVAFAAPAGGNRTIGERFDYLRDYWYPASSAIDEHFTEHVTQYDALLERVRTGPGLEFIDRAFFKAGPADPAERQQLFLGASMLALMERVFIDLDLEHDGEHPHNAGWMAIFGHWLQQPAVRQAWDASRDSYGRRFQWFVDGL